ncbi:Arginyl-tRNA--protein transferase 1 [Trapelia coarctata]|nr:Arginyl-tRNA--protein transferase 1 [Trapelia coarctata]
MEKVSRLELLSTKPDPTLKFLDLEQLITNRMLDATAFKPRKDQRRAVNRFNEYVMGQDYIGLAAGLCPRTREEKKRRRNKFETCEAIHEAEYKNIKRPVHPKTQRPIEPAHKFEITLEPDHFTKEKYALFANYQKHVHKEPPSKISPSGFKSFLCSGLGQMMYDRDGKERTIGSYHQCYRLDGELVAMGVLDLMPNCVSSVYHDSVENWEFGKLSALQEITLAVEGGYNYYYMGFYIHSCIKMRYKANFRPAYLLDPESYAWDPLDADYLARLSARKYVSLSRERRLGIPAPTVGPDVQDGSKGKSHSEQGRAQSATADDEDSPATSTPSSLFDRNMPGIIAPKQVTAEVPIADVHYRYGGSTISAGDVLGEWNLEKMKDPTSFHGFAAEFAACVGSALIKEIVIDL